MIYEELVLRAEALFKQHGSIVTGHGLMRKELRLLERKGLIERQLMKNKDTGAAINVWKPVSLAAELIAKKNKNSLQNEKKVVI